MMQIVVQLSCDYCACTLIGPTEAAAARQAAAIGWIVDGAADDTMCPKCVASAEAFR